MNNRDTFSSYHPVVNFLYFAAVLAFGMVLMHPVCLVLSLVCASAYAVCLNGKKAVRVGLIFILPMLIVAALMNPAFNHQGNTILTYLPSGNPLTLESIVYGIAAATMLAAVITWFACFNSVMTSDKLIYLFGYITPALSLIFSISLRLVPRFKTQLKVISNAQKCIGRDVSDGSLLQKAKNGIRILSIMITWTLENAIDTADSMRGRGYGLPGRTVFSIYRFDRRDACAMLFILMCTAYIIIGMLTGGLYFRYFPTIKGLFEGVYPVSIFAVYLALGAMPLILNVKEDIQWK